MRLVSLVPVVMFGGLFVRDYNFLSGLKKWPTYKQINRPSIYVTETGAPEPMRDEEAEKFVRKFDFSRMMFRIARRNFESCVMALAASRFVAFVDFLLSP